MTSQKRQQKIIELLDRNEEIDVATLAEQLSTSDMTIRRDLNRMASEGLIIRTHGGAMKTGLLVNKTAFENKVAVNLDAKDAICRLAAQEIKDGDIIFMDCGSTVFRLCNFIRNKNIKVITNSLPVVAQLINSAASVNLIGGEVDRDRQAIHGAMAEQHIAHYTATKAFLGVDGISPDGLFANTEKEASITRAFAARSKKNYLLCDSTKINKEAYLKFAGLSLFHTLITDKETPSLPPIRKKGLKIILP
ncbi:MAG: DeoR/GlpR transcriptional regulator [Bacteroidetes bacterium]|nr:DeoR/GlpR transcriptional regulator [Bacteroidota bacterium]